MISVVTLCLMAWHTMLFFFGATVEPSLDAVALEVRGQVPTIMSDERVLFARDERGDIWMFGSEGTWTFSVDSLKWRTYPKLNLNLGALVAGYDQSRRQFLFWSSGVGEVYTWQPGDSVSFRIDHAFNHRNQQGHAGVVHPRNGNIYAFGGEGFWENTGILTRFDRTTLEWQIVSLSDAGSYPDPRSGSIALMDPQSNQILVMSGMAYVGHRQDISSNFEVFNDFWTFSLSESRWTKKSLTGFPTGAGIDLETVGSWGSQFNAVLDSSHSLAWFPLRVVANNTNISLFSYDFKRGSGLLMPNQIPWTAQSSRLKYLALDSSNNRLLLFWHSLVGHHREFRIQVSEYRLPHPDTVRELISTAGVSDASAGKFPFWMAASMGGLLIMVAGMGWMWVKTRPAVTSSPHESDRRMPFVAQSRPEPPIDREIRVYFIGKPRVEYLGESVNSQLGKTEFEVFLWLIWQMKMGREYVLTDIMEPLFWGGTGNPDYVRKMRNNTLKRLDEQLAAIIPPKYKRNGWVVDRVLKEDRRKREYGLDLSPLVLITDCDPFFDAVQHNASSLDLAAYNNSFAKELAFDALLGTCRGPWADAVRRDVGEFNARLDK